MQDEYEIKTIKEFNQSYSIVLSVSDEFLNKYNIEDAYGNLIFVYYSKRFDLMEFNVISSTTGTIKAEGLEGLGKNHPLIEAIKRELENLREM